MLNTTASQDSLRNLSLKQVRTAMLQFQERQTTNNAYRIGQLYNYMVDTKLAQKANYRGALDYLRQHVQAVPRSTLCMYGTVARHFSEQVCTRFGTTCLNLLLTYEEATGVQSDHDEPGGTLIQVPGANGLVTRKPFRDCSTEDMRKALQRLRKPRSGQSTSTASPSSADGHEQTVKARFPSGKRTRGQPSLPLGELVIHFKNIPKSQVEKLSEALLGVTAG